MLCLTNTDTSPIVQEILRLSLTSSLASKIHSVRFVSTLTNCVIGSCSCFLLECVSPSFCELMSDMDSSDSSTTLFVPFSHKATTNLLTFLTTGTLQLHNLEDVLEVGRMARALGIDTSDWEMLQLGSNNATSKRFNDVEDKGKTNLKAGTGGNSGQIMNEDVNMKCGGAEVTLKDRGQEDGKSKTDFSGLNTNNCEELLKEKNEKIGKKLLRCNICQRGFSLLLSYRYHNKSMRHLMNLKKSRHNVLEVIKENENNLKKSQENLVDVIENKVENNLVKAAKKVPCEWKNGKKFVCLICSKFCSTEYNLKVHCNSRNHLQRKKQMEIDNSMNEKLM